MSCLTLWPASSKITAVRKLLILLLTNTMAITKPNFLSINSLEFDVWKMWILWKMRVWNCEFWRKCDFEIVNFEENETLKMWILWKMIFWNCEFCEKIRFWKCVFCEKWDFEVMNFVESDIFKMWLFGQIENFCPSVNQ